MFTFKFVASGTEILSMSFPIMGESERNALTKSARTFFSQNPTDVEIIIENGEYDEYAYDLKELQKFLDRLADEESE